MPDYDELHREQDARFKAYVADQKVQIGKLKARARKLGLTLRSESGTATGWYMLGAMPKRLSDALPFSVKGLSALEAWIVRFETAVGALGLHPADDELREAYEKAHDQAAKDHQAAYQARIAPGCLFCGEPKDGLTEFSGGDDAGNGPIHWLHARCVEPQRAKNRERFEAWRERQRQALG